ncbi:MAG: hypothetical protein IVW57_00110 [Ktedonobacterales bacterium]|nr:hypothetical protein [Ktedonobacterales bacterium]
MSMNSSHSSKPLYTHAPHAHTPRNINTIQQAEHAQSASFNTRVAVLLTRNVGTMQTAYLFAAIGIGSLIGVFTGNAFLAALFGSISSYFLQLVLLPILSVGQNVLSRHQELQADEMFATSQHSFHDIEQMMRHLDAQDAELLKQTAMLQRLMTTGAGAGAGTGQPRRDPTTGRYTKRSMPL